MTLRVILAAALASAMVPTAAMAQVDILDVAVKRVERVRFDATAITREAVARYASILRQEDFVDIQSKGGDLAAALEMAQQTERHNARLVLGIGSCEDECALVWLAAPDRIGHDFMPVFFDGGTLPWTEAMAFRPEIATPTEHAAIHQAAQGWNLLLHERGIAPWLQTCAWRLRNVRFEVWPPEIPIQDVSVRERLRIVAAHDAVWFPKEILEAAGVTGLREYEPPSALQRDRHSRQRPDGRPGRILWADSDACDLERNGG